MDGRPTWTNFDEAGDYVVPNVLSPRDLVSRPEIMDETVPHTPPFVKDSLNFFTTRPSLLDSKFHRSCTNAPSQQVKWPRPCCCGGVRK